MTRTQNNPKQEYKLPRHLTLFVGRSREIAEISGLLADPTCRLLTLVGAGGTGKTRLAIETATTAGADFDDGVYFVPLQAVSSAELLAPAIADAVGLSIAGSDDPQTQVLNYLRTRELLLVLDNFEQLLVPPLSSPPKGGKEGVEFLTDILKEAPDIKLIVTSRELLNLAEEWRYPVTGLATPSSAQVDGWSSYDAVQLFAERVRRVRWNFSLEAEADSVIQICRLVEGMPLALEMAAAWLKTLTCAEVAAEIRRSLDFLASSQAGLPERHRSVRVIFDYSWQRLSPQERDVLMRLSVFRGGFRRAAAESVAGATLPLLTALVDKSLLRWEPDARRYQTHELLRQFGEEQLAKSPELLSHTRDLHATYHAGFLGDRFEDLTGQGQLTALAEIGAELDNVRAAWQWAARQRRVADLEVGAMALHTFYQYRGHFLEGTEAFAVAVAAAEKAPPSPERDRGLAMLLTCAGWLEMRFGRVQKATQMQESALALYQALDMLPPPGQGTDPLTALSQLAATRGDYDQAQALGQQAWQRAAGRADKKNMAFASFGLAGAALAQGDYETALQHAHETLALTQAAENQWFMAYVYNHLGQINQALGNLTAAANYYQASYTIKESLDDPEGMALASSYLGEIALAQAEYQQARDLYRQSLALYQELGDRGGLVQAFQGLGMAAYHLDDRPTAQEHLQQALQIASEAAITPLILSVLANIGIYYMESGAQEQGLATLSFVQQHPVSDQMTRNKVRECLTAHQVGSPAELLAQAGRDEPQPELKTVIATLLAELSVPVTPDAGASPPAPATAPPSEQPLVDPLSERELEVLECIAAGLKNREIAQELTVTLATVKAHINHIYSKLAVRNRVEAVSRARELNLLREV